MLFPRIYDNLEKYFYNRKILVIFGPRRVGKTTLIKNYLKKTNLKYKLVNGDDLSVQEILSSQRLKILADYCANYQLLVIDEAQKIPNIGNSLKIIVDNIDNIKIIATGSSSFELLGQVGEPLTGRKINLILYPLSQIELSKIYNFYELKENLDNYLIFGSYPEVTATKTKNEKIIILNELVNSYLLKDILELEKVKAAKILVDLLRLLAFQVGKEVSLNELANRLKIDVKTVGRYLDLFEKSFIIYNLRGFSKNLRSEIYKKSKYYFFDNGVRNALISNFNDLEKRDDIGALWENFLVIERIKLQNYKNLFTNNYFWRTWEQKEIDWIEEKNGKLYIYEFKYQTPKKTYFKDFAKIYSPVKSQIITKDNYLDFVI